MKIYTKTGDAGQTGLFGGGRLAKDETRICAYGSFDELNSVLGLTLANGLQEPLAGRILRLQGELFQLGAELATPRGKTPGIQLLEEPHILAMEKEIDEMEAQLIPLKNFILPGGTPPAAWLHVARTVSRRAEREAISLNRGEPLRPALLQYMNRLSDYLFVCARFANHLAQVKDIPWKPARE